MNGLERVLTDTMGILSELGVGRALVGGLAVSVRTEPRFTRDVDVAVSVSDDTQAEDVVRSHTTRGYAVVAGVEHDAGGRLAGVRLQPPDGSPEGVMLDLLFASSGIEPEVVADAEPLEILRVLF